MALTTVLWTLLHFGFVVAPLAAGALPRVTVDRFAVKRLEQSNSDDRFDATIGTLETVRFLVFCGTWIVLAASPVLLLAAFPQVIRPIQSLGAALALRLMTGQSGNEFMNLTHARSCPPRPERTGAGEMPYAM